MTGRNAILAGETQGMKGATLFSGIGAPECAAPFIDWRWSADIDDFANAVRAHHWPGVPNLGDVSSMEAGDIERPDVIVFGSPCQSFSVAGKRLGLADPRGNLALIALRLVAELRPRWFVFENVPGLLSSADGEDFAAFLRAVRQCGYTGAYRVLDAQHFGVPQRRRRVFFVGHLGDDWRPSAAVLFEPESLSGHPSPGREAGQDVAASVAASAGHHGYSSPRGDGSDNLIAIQERAGAEGSSGPGGKGYRTDGMAYTLEARHHVQAIASTGPLSQWPAEIAPTLNAHYGDKQGLEDQHALGGAGHFVPFDTTQITSKGNYSNPKPGDPCHPLAAGAHAPAVAFNHQSGGDFRPMVSEGVANALQRCQGQAVAHFQDSEYGCQQYDTAAIRAGRIPEHSMIIGGENYAYAAQARSIEILRALRSAIGEEAFSEWCSGIHASLLPAQILRPDLYGSGVRRAGEYRHARIQCALAQSQGETSGALRTVRLAQGEGRSPQGRRPVEQLAGQLGAYLSELSSAPSQRARFLHDLRETDEGSRLLREALPAMEEVGRSARSETEPAYAPSVRRLTAEECEALQGLPLGFTDIPWRGKSAPDGRRYKALGNSMAVPVLRWILERLWIVDIETPDTRRQNPGASAGAFTSRQHRPGGGVPSRLRAAQNAAPCGSEAPAVTSRRPVPVHLGQSCLSDQLAGAASQDGRPSLFRGRS